MARTQGRRRSSATSSPEDAARRSSFGRFNKNLFMNGPSLPLSQSMDDRTARDEGLTFLRRLAKRDPYLGAQLVVASAIALDLSLPTKVTLGPSWLLPSLEGLLLVGLTVFAPNLSDWRSRRRIAIALIGLVSAVNLFSLGLLVHFLVHGGQEKGRDLIFAGTVLWITNVLLFGLWYWELDRGGPVERANTPDAVPDFLFPQMATPKHAPPGWMPGLLDYLYTSFTNATAFSPTDTMPLSWTAKVLMAAQSLAALVTVGLVVARAVNILS
jgi:hypothetical protein